MGFQNIIKLLKLDEQNLNYRHLKIKSLYVHVRTVHTDIYNYITKIELCTQGIRY